MGFVIESLQMLFGYSKNAGLYSTEYNTIEGDFQSVDMFYKLFDEAFPI